MVLVPRQGQIPCIELGIELRNKSTSNYIIIHFTTPANYVVVYTPALSLVPPFVVPNNNEPTSHVPARRYLAVNS